MDRYYYGGPEAYIVIQRKRSIMPWLFGHKVKAFLRSSRSGLPVFKAVFRAVTPQEAERKAENYVRWWASNLGWRVVGTSTLDAVD